VIGRGETVFLAACSEHPAGGEAYKLLQIQMQVVGFDDAVVELAEAGCEALNRPKVSLRKQGWPYCRLNSWYCSEGVVR
jgi:hypothetical protein